MDFGAVPSLIGATIEVAAVNLLLGADNAVMIALACRPLPRERRQPVLLFGVVGAIALRFGLAALTNAVVLPVPGLKLAAAIFLLWVAVRLLSDFSEERRVESESGGEPSAAARSAFLWQSALIIIAADAVMSLDNVVAMVSVAQGSVSLLVLGLILSVPAIMYGSYLLTKVLDDWPILMMAGAVLLGWIAGQMAMSDALIGPWMAREAPALASLLPALSACYVYLVGHSAIVVRSDVAPLLSSSSVDVSHT